MIFLGDKDNYLLHFLLKYLSLLFVPVRLEKTSRGNFRESKVNYSPAHSKVDNLNYWNVCELHWKRIKNAINTIEKIEKIYKNITFLSNDTCKSLPQYRKYLAKKDDHIEVKKRIESLFISG
jgi:hypothetical protein